MRAALAVVLALALPSCTVTSSGTCATPLQSACQAKAQEQDISAQLAIDAARRNVTIAQIDAEYMSACEGQLQADLDQTLAALQALAADGGAPVSGKKP